MPSCPLKLTPQHLTPPPASIAHVWLAPRAMAVAETPAGMGGAVRVHGVGVCKRGGCWCGGSCGVSGILARAPNTTPASEQIPRAENGASRLRIDTSR